MGIFDILKKKLGMSKETEAPKRTRDAITTSTEKTKPETKSLTPSEPQPSTRVEKTKILEGYKVKDASTHNWQDESSHEAEARLKKSGIQLPWHYNDTFGEDFKVLALRAGGVGAVFFVKATRFGERIYAAKTLQRFLQRDYLEMPTYQQKKIADDFLEEALPWLEMGQHHSIVPVHLLENIIHPATKRNVPFVFSEFMEKGDLKNLLLEKGRFELEEARSAGLQVCEALLHAYKHGLSAHKDLKPDNIMVYREGVYKVTDFSAGIIGTPGYMAPEQVVPLLGLKENINIDQRADQFAIGIIMLELLLGEHPFPWIIRATYKEEAEKFFREGVGEIPDNLSGALREIIARCLSPDPDNRFPNISALKEALLGVYRTEFGREYRFPEVEIDDSAEWWFNRGRAFHNIGRYAGAEKPFEEALRMFKAIQGTEIGQARCLINLGSVYNKTGKFSEAEDNLKEALRMSKAISGTEIEQATCLKNLGSVYRSTGKFSEAEGTLKEALRMFKAIPGTETEQADCLANLGNIYVDIGKFSEAEANHKEALRISKRIPGSEKKQASCLTNLGNVYQSTGKYSEAEENLKEALRMLKPLPGTEIGQAECLMNMGVVYDSTGKFSEAADNLKEALRMFKPLPGTEIEQANCLVNLGNVYRNTSKFSEAADNHKEALRMFKAIPGTEIDQASCLTNLGNVYQSTGRYSEAEENLKEALRMFKPIPGTEIEQANCLMNLGVVYRNTGKFSEAEGNFKEALRMFKAIHGTETEQADCLVNLGNIYVDIGKFSEAEANHKEALRIFKRIPGSEIKQARCLMNLGNVYESTGKFSEAEGNLKEALRMFKAIPGTEIDQANCLVNLGVVYDESTGKFSEAEGNLKEALRMFKAIPRTEISQARCLTGLGILYNGIQEFGKARNMLKDALEICERYPQGTEQIKNACLTVLSKIP